MREDRSPKTAAIEIRGAEQDAEKHSRKETLKFEMHERKDRGGNDDAHPGILCKPDQDALQVKIRSDGGSETQVMQWAMRVAHAGIKIGRDTEKENGADHLHQL